MRHLLPAIAFAGLLHVGLVAAAGVSGHLTFKAPDAWKSRPPASGMRVAEFVLPRAAGDAKDAELIVYYFGAQGGGGAQANIDRWVGQMPQPDGKASAAATATRTIHGLTVSTVDVSGTYVAEMRPGAAEHYNEPGFRLRAAVVDTPAGPYYIKLTGPAKTVAAASAAYDAFLASLSYSASPPE